MPKSMKKVHSLAELRRLSRENPAYARLMVVSSHNLGGPDGDDPDAAYRWLCTNAEETDENGVVEEVNFCRELV